MDNEEDVRVQFRISVHEIERGTGWTLIETNVPQFAIREIVRDLWDKGYVNESILIESL